MAFTMVNSLRMTATRARRAGFAGLAQMAVEGLERWVMPDDDQASHVERRPNRHAAALNLALAAAKSAAVPVHRRDASEGSDLVAVDAAELRQVDNQGAGALPRLKCSRKLRCCLI
jgi:hypothetical protein